MEKTIIEGKFSKTNIITILSSIIAIGILIMCVKNHMYWCTRGRHVFYYCYYFKHFYILGGPFALLAVFFQFLLNSCSITVTDKRVFGKAAFGSRVDLPIDMISSVGTGAFKSIAVATSSGKIRFYLLANRDKVFDSISQILLLRQETKKESTIKQEPAQSTADELKKFKELLDCGIITQDEFDTKKKQLLGK